MEAVSKEELLECLLLFANGLESSNSTKIKSCDERNTPKEMFLLSQNDIPGSAFEPKAASVDEQADEIKRKNKSSLSLEKGSGIGLVDSGNQSQSNVSVPQLDDFRTCFMKLAKAKYPHLATCFKNYNQNYKFRAGLITALPPNTQLDSNSKVPIGTVTVSSSKMLSQSKLETEAESKAKLRFFTPEKAVSTLFSYSQCLLKIAEAISPNLLKLLSDRLGRNLQISSNLNSRNRLIKTTLPLEVKPPILQAKIHVSPGKQIMKPNLPLKRKGNASPSLILKSVERPATESALLNNRKSRKCLSNESCRSAQNLDTVSSQTVTYLSKSTQCPSESNVSSHLISKQAATRASPGVRTSHLESNYQIQRGEAAINGKPPVNLRTALVDKTESSIRTSVPSKSTNSTTNPPTNDYTNVSYGKCDLVNAISKDLNARTDRKNVIKRSINPVRKLHVITEIPDSPKKPANQNSGTPNADNYMALPRPIANQALLQNLRSRIPIRSIYHNSEASSVASDCESFSWKYRPPKRNIKSVVKPINPDPESVTYLRSKSLDSSTPARTIVQSNTTTISSKTLRQKDRAEPTKKLDPKCRPCLLKLAHKFDPVLFNYLNECDKRT